LGRVGLAEKIGYIYSVAWHPGKKVIAIAGSEDTEPLVKLWDVGSAPARLLRTLHGGGHDVPSIHWLDGGTKLVTCSLEDSATWDSMTGTRLQAMHGCPLDWSGDGTKLARSTESGIEVTDIGTGAIIRTISYPGPTLDYQVASLTWAPDSRYAAVLTALGSFWVPDLASGATIILAPSGSGIYRSPVGWSPDSKRVAVARIDGSFTIWDVEKRAVELVIQILPKGEWLAWNPTNLAYSSSLNGDAYGAIRSSEDSRMVVPLQAFRSTLRDADFSRSQPPKLEFKR
jgi:WD40 repeat protein